MRRGAGSSGEGNANPGDGSTPSKLESSSFSRHLPFSLLSDSLSESEQVCNHAYGNLQRAAAVEKEVKAEEEKEEEDKAEKEKEEKRDSRKPALDTGNVKLKIEKKAAAPKPEGPIGMYRHDSIDTLPPLKSCASLVQGFGI